MQKTKKKTIAEDYTKERENNNLRVTSARTKINFWKISRKT